MLSVDVRTRAPENATSVDPEALFGETLPELIATRAPNAIAGARELNVRPFAIEVDGQSWTLRFDGEAFSVSSGDAGAATVVRLDVDGLGDVVNDIRTPVGFFTGGDLDLARGRLEDFLDWFVILRSLLDDRPVHTSGAVTFHEPDGSPLDFGRAFTLDDDPEAMAHFLGEAGFVHVAGVFTEAEMAAVSSDMDAAAPSYAPDDGRSWWARTKSGENRLVRMQYFHNESPVTATLLADDRLLRLARLTDDGHSLGKPGSNRNIIEALVKPIGVVEGISDVPWHKDCSLGGHSYRCCSMTVGISVTGTDGESGQLRVVAGSHRALIQPAFLRRDLDLPVLDLPTRTGDITIHLSCTLHMAQPPVTCERRVLYTDFSLPDGGHTAGEDKLRRIREGAYKTVSQEPSPAG